MKLGDVRDGVVYCTRGSTVGTWTLDGGFESRSRVPLPSSGVEPLRSALLHNRPVKRLLRPIVGTFTSANVWPLSNGHLVATVGRWLFASRDRGGSWSMVHELPASSGPMGVLPTSVCEHDGRVYLAEYPLTGESARILVSDDGGFTWSTFLSTADVRHFHGVFADPYTGKLWATTGDSDDESAIGRIDGGEFRPVGSGSQRWRCVGLVFTEEYLLWGMDCSFAEQIALLRLPRSALTGDSPEPEPEVVGTTDATVFYAETLRTGGETWTIISTASSTGVDRYAPPDSRRNVSGPCARVLAASSKTAFETWHEVASFPRRRPLGDRTSHLPATGAYVFLATDPDRGLLVNPYNVRGHDGEIDVVSHETFRRMSRASQSVAPEMGGDVRC
jgi:hypothetical protein